MDEEILSFYRRHLANWDPENLTGHCPLCMAPGFLIQPGGGFGCQNCNFRGKDPQDFVDQVRQYKSLHDLRRIVREERNRKILLAQGLDRSVISGMLTDLENQRTLVWYAIGDMVYDETDDGDGIIHGPSSIDELVGMLTGKVDQGEEDVRGHLASLIEFKDIEIQDARIIVRRLWR